MWLKLSFCLAALFAAKDQNKFQIQSIHEFHLLLDFNVLFQCITMARTQGTSAAAGGQAGGLTGFPIGGGATRMTPQQIQLYMTTQFGKHKCSTGASLSKVWSSRHTRTHAHTYM